MPTLARVSAPKVLALFAVVATATGAEIFRADFSAPLDPGWSWIREDPSAWRRTNGALEIRLLPGNMWGPANDAKNVLTRLLPDTTKETEILATVENHPTEQYEQVDLVWFYSDSHMVKIGLELVDGKLSIVMGREEGDRTRTMSITPITANTVDLRLATVSANRIAGFFREHKTGEWQKAGECSLPQVAGISPRISIQCYQGPARVERWARIKALTIKQKRS